LGEPWPGVREAERELHAEAQATGRSVAEVQRDRGAIYERWLAEQARDAEEGDRTASAGPAGGSSGRQGGGG